MREFLIEELRKEVVGPGIEANPGANIPYTDVNTGEELLLRGVHISFSPADRYGAGILYPRDLTVSEDEKQQDKIENTVADIDEEQGPNHISNNNGNITGNGSDDTTTDEDIVSLANQLKPSAMGLTIRCKRKGSLSIKISSARYELANNTTPKLRYNDNGNLEPTDRLCEYFTRIPLEIESIIIDLQTFEQTQRVFRDDVFQDENGEWLKLIITNRSTSVDNDDNVYTLTFTITNVRGGGVTDNALYQNELKITTSDNTIIPYKEKKFKGDNELDELNLLYRKKKMFGVGHGCAAVWNETDNDFVKEVKTSVLPEYEIPLIEAEDNEYLAMYKMSDLSSEKEWAEAKQALVKLCKEYENWIEARKDEIDSWDGNVDFERYIPAAERNIEKCKNNLDRIKRGVELLTAEGVDENLVKCFRWMNRAMLWQQQRSKFKQRKWVRSNNNIVLPSYNIVSLVDFHNSDRNKGRWRPFQLAFVLMNIEAIWDEISDERKILDLIWFPTGGGKTEAYLGLSAFQIFVRRIKAVTEGHHNYEKYYGTAILMRYTLRLLTMQQYERAASLICACEIIRRDNKTLLGPEGVSNDPEMISIGLWVGGSTPTKNTVGYPESPSAIQSFNDLRNDYSAPYKFIVMKCPCCGAQIGKLDKAVRNTNNRIKGLSIIGAGNNTRIVFKCENVQCETSNWDELPLYVVDQDIYERKPTLVIGTVDKFAMLTWKASKSGQNPPANENEYLQAGTLFGFRYNHAADPQTRVSRVLPPQLIIQDELHLIAGPLGTMVGLYETMIQTLCNNYRQTSPPFIPEGDFIPPKIIASSATISRAADQVKNLYGITEEYLNIFPPQGIEFGETWFSKVKSTTEKPGRKYVGILAPAYKSIQTAETRVYSRMLQAVKSGNFNDQEKDYYWTIVGYFNSIRGLGSANTLISGDMSQYLKTIRDRELIEFNNWRRPNSIDSTELTSRMNDSEIPEILKKLETSFTNYNDKLDICLATNMIATGVDVSRLGLMVVHGQPKTTAEYIQASSRVGRDSRFAAEINKFIGQGLVLTIYSPTKPRDKSHYEQFQSYHSRIYSNVEPTSVTPFSVNAREKALHAVFIGIIRQMASGNLRQRPDGLNDHPREYFFQTVKNIVVNRCDIVDPIEVENVRTELDQLIQDWLASGIQNYGNAMNMTIPQHVLMYSPMGEVPDGLIRPSSPFPKKVNTSMRGVDTETNLQSI
jgi:hypothetical protein